MLNARKFGLAAGLLWGVCMFITTLLSVFTGYGKIFLVVMASIYPGYSISLLGSVVGFTYGFFDAFIGFFVLAWLYNKFLVKKHP